MSLFSFILVNSRIGIYKKEFFLKCLYKNISLMFDSVMKIET